jgi:hypothetical protein
MAETLPRYPVYVISKGRADQCLTARFLTGDGVPFRLVVEPQEAERYAERHPEAELHALPFSNLGRGSIPARNWVWEHALAEGAERHWILDDNIRYMRRTYKGRRIVCNSGPALACVEDFVDRYENVAIGGLNYEMFVIPGKVPPFFLNVHVYSCMLIRNANPERWRGRYNEDTDLCLQVLAAGWCTVLVNVFSIHKMWTMSMKGGNTDELYRGDGRLKMARSLERAWPHVVRVDRRWGRPQHVIDWRKFRGTRLRLKPGVDPSKMPPNEYGMRLTELSPVKSESLRAVAESYRRDVAG